MLKQSLKRFAVMTTAAAFVALGLSTPGQAATANTVTTYYTFVWNGYTYKIPVITQKQPVQKAPVTDSGQTTGPTATTPTVDQIASQTAVSEVQQVVNLVNAERAKVGLAPLKVNTNLANMAKVKAEDMRDLKYFSHQSPTYGSPFEMMKTFGIRYSYAGENIAAGQKTPEDVMKSWMNSPGHKANILSKNFTEIGVGLAKGGSYGTYWVQEFIRP